MFLRALPLQEAFGWLARHVRALADTAPGTASPCLRPDDDHGALIDRIRYAAEAIRDIAEEDTAHDDTAQNDNAQDVREDGRRQDLHDAHPGAPPDSDGEAGRWALRLDAALAAASGRGGNGHRLAARVITELLANGRTPDMTPERYWVESDDDGHRGRT
jgi:hypothetical protein